MEVTGSPSHEVRRWQGQNSILAPGPCATATSASNPRIIQFSSHERLLFHGSQQHKHIWGQSACICFKFLSTWSSSPADLDFVKSIDRADLFHLLCKTTQKEIFFWNRNFSSIFCRSLLLFTSVLVEFHQFCQSPFYLGLARYLTFSNGTWATVMWAVSRSRPDRVRVRASPPPSCSSLENDQGWAVLVSHLVLCRQGQLSEGRATWEPGFLA